jgi:hypothetical protein
MSWFQTFAIVWVKTSHISFKRRLRLGDSVRIRSVGSSAGRGVAAKAQRGEGRLGDGLGGSVVLVNRALNILVAPSKANVTVEFFGRKH